MPNFSLSGLKTAVRNEASRMIPLEEQDIADLCASFQAAVLDSTADRLSVGLQIVRTSDSARRMRWSRPAASPPIRRSAARCRPSPQKRGTTLIMPPPALCTDNGAMIAWAGAERLALGLIDGMDAPPRARWLLDADAKAPAGHSKTRAAY